MDGVMVRVGEKNWSSAGFNGVEFHTRSILNGVDWSLYGVASKMRRTMSGEMVLVMGLMDGCLIEISGKGMVVVAVDNGSCGLWSGPMFGEGIVVKASVDEMMRSVKRRVGIMVHVWARLMPMLVVYGLMIYV